MTSNQNPEGICSGRIETTEDVEGHGANVRVVSPDTTDDVEGHGVQSGRAAPDTTDDVEGHGIGASR